MTVVDERAARLAEVFEVLGPVYRHVYRLVERDVAVEGLTLGLRAVLDLVRSHGALTVPQMARAQALSRQFVQRSVNEGLARAWLRAVANPGHKRSSLIELTDVGRDVIGVVADRELAELAGLGEGLALEDVDACLRVLLALRAGLDRDDAPDAP